MSLTADLQTYLLAQSGIASLVGAQVYWQAAPQATAFPYITFFLVSEEREHDVAGQCGVVFAFYQVDCWHEGSADIHAIADAVRNAVDGYTGTMGSTTVQYSKLINRHEFIDSPQFGKEAVEDRVMLEVEIHSVESIPTFS